MAGPNPSLIKPSVLRRTVLRGLPDPTDFAVTGDGLVLYTSRGQGLFAARATVNGAPLFKPKDLAASRSTGTLALTLDPDFGHNRFVYVLMRSTLSGHEDCRVVRITLDAESTRVSDRRDIFIVPGAGDTAATPSQTTALDGLLRFGPDGYLYIALSSDAATGSPGASPLKAGTVWRIDREGHAAPGNAAPAGADKRAFAAGLRNTSALAFHAQTDTLLVGQRGGDQPDALSLVKPGAAAPAPAWRGGKAGEGLSAVERLRDAAWGEWRNAYALAFDRAQRIDVVKLDAAGKVLAAMPVLDKLGVGFKALAHGPDGLYVLTSGKAGGDEIWLLTPQ